MPSAWRAGQADDDAVRGRHCGERPQPRNRCRWRRHAMRGGPTWRRGWSRRATGAPGSRRPARGGVTGPGVGWPVRDDGIEPSHGGVPARTAIAGSSKVGCPRQHVRSRRGTDASGCAVTPTGRAEKRSTGAFPGCSRRLGRPVGGARSLFGHRRPVDAGLAI